MNSFLTFHQLHYFLLLAFLTHVLRINFVSEYPKREETFPCWIPGMIATSVRSIFLSHVSDFHFHFSQNLLYAGSIILA